MTDTLPTRFAVDDAEAQIIGACALGDAGVVASVVAKLVPEDFKDRDLALLFRCVVSLASRREAVDWVTLNAEAKRISPPGVRAELFAELHAAYATAANVDLHAAIIREASCRRALRAFAQETLRAAGDDATSVETTLVRAGEAVREIATRNAGGEDEAPGMDRLLVAAMATMDEGAAPSRLRTGIDAFDHQFRGLPTCGVTLVGARPGVGKTALCAQLAHRWADAGQRVWFYSLERTREDVALVILAQQSGVGIDRLSSDVLRTSDEYERIAAALPGISALGNRLVIREGARISPLTIRAEIARAEAANRPSVVVVDYLGLLDTSAVTTRGTSREQQVSWLSRELKLLSLEFRCAVVVAAQLNRQITGRVDAFPRLSDLRDSGAQEQDADMIVFPHRPAALVVDASERQAAGDAAYLVVGKNRRGPVGSAEVSWDGPSQRFGDVATRF